MLYDLKNKKQIGEPRKDDGFKTEPGFKYYDSNIFQFNDQRDKLHFLVKKKGSTKITLAYLEVKKGLNQPFTHEPESFFAFESKGIEIDGLKFEREYNLFVGHENQETKIIRVKDSKIDVINRFKEKAYFRHRMGKFIYYQDPEDEEFKTYDMSTNET